MVRYVGKEKEWMSLSSPLYSGSVVRYVGKKKEWMSLSSGIFAFPAFERNERSKPKYPASLLPSPRHTPDKRCLLFYRWRKKSMRDSKL